VDASDWGGRCFTILEMTAEVTRGEQEEFSKGRSKTRTIAEKWNLKKRGQKKLGGGESSLSSDRKEKNRQGARRKACWPV